ncbi:MAG: hypothetical protein ABR905_13370 [Terracidiphilus sp.]|jgi:hypothetical protein
MSRLSSFAKGVEETSIGGLDGRDVQPPKAIHVLSVGPVDFGCMVHDALLDGPNPHLSIAPSYRELWAISKQESIQVVILHNTLSSFELEDASRFIRRRWPHARILVLHSGEGFLEDALYDERVALTVAPGVLLAAIERLAGGWQGQRSQDAEL